jgi:hypothetical protein
MDEERQAGILLVCVQLQQVHDYSESVISSIWNTIYTQYERRESSV